MSKFIELSCWRENFYSTCWTQLFRLCRCHWSYFPLKYEKKKQQTTWTKSFSKHLQTTFREISNPLSDFSRIELITFIQDSNDLKSEAKAILECSEIVATDPQDVWREIFSFLFQFPEKSSEIVNNEMQDRMRYNCKYYVVSHRDGRIWSKN